MPLVVLNEIRRRYGALEALRGVTLTLEPGVIGLVGNNGAGKSTLLKILLGLLRPTSGTGSILGVDLQQAGRQLRARIGYMAEAAATVPILTGVEFVTLSGDLYGMPHREAQRRAHEVLQYVGLGELRYRALEEYSVGNQQRLKLAASLVHDPELLLLDEPTSGLDPGGRESFLNLLADWAQQSGKSLLLSTHLLGDVRRLCQQVVVLDQGQIRHNGRLEDQPLPTQQLFALAWRGAGDSFLIQLQAVNVRIISTTGTGRAVVAVPPDWSTTTFFRLAAASGILLVEMKPETVDLETAFWQLTATGTSHGN